MRLRALLCSCSILVATPLGAQPAPERFELRVPGGADTLDRLGLTIEERGSALVLLARGLNGVTTAALAGSLAMSVSEVLGTPATAPDDVSPQATVLAPLNERTWRRLLGIGESQDLFRAIVLDRGALLVAAGALQAGAGVRPWLMNHPQVLAHLVRTWPGSFSVVAGALSLDEKGWQVPGGPALAPAWTTLTGAAPSRTDEFLRRLLTRDGGRLARFYATLAALDDAWLDAVTAPLSGEDRVRSLAALYALARDAESPAAPNTHPFQLGYADLASLLLPLDDLVLSSLPSAAGRWPALLESRVESRSDAAAIVTRPAEAAPIAATLRAQLRGAPRTRRDRVTVVALARVLWNGDAPVDVQTDAVYALSHFSRFRGLLLSLDRIGVHDPGTWARAVEAARLVDAGSGRDRPVRLGLYQGALAMVERTTLVGSLSIADATRAIDGLTTAVLQAPALDAAIHAWLLDTFIPALPPLIRPDRYSGPTAYESRVLQALAGPPAATPHPFEWEGFSYDVDVTAAEHQRVLAIRDLLPSPGLDAALDRRDGVALAAALRTLAYAPAMGDPSGAITLSPDVVERHDFGGSRTAPGRDVGWMPPQDRTGTGAPWHAAGSLLGLDIAFARLALQRLSMDDMPAVPTINLNDQLALTRSRVMVQARALDNATRDELAAAIARGRTLVREAAADRAALAGLGRAVGWPWVDQMAWVDGRMPAGDVVARFSLRQLLAIGRPRLSAAALQPWGVAGDAVDGRLVTRFDPPRSWDVLAGRPETGVLASQMPDLMLRLVEVTAAHQVPAALIPALLAFATQDYWHDVEARFADDWPAMVRGARRLPETRVEDYVAALASGGPLRGK